MNYACHTYFSGFLLYFQVQIMQNKNKIPEKRICHYLGVLDEWLSKLKLGGSQVTRRRRRLMFFYQDFTQYDIVVG